MKKRWTAALLALMLTAALLPGTAHAAPTDRSAGSRLTGTDLAVYQTLRTEAAKIANGTRTGTTIRIPKQSALSWSLEELGIKEGGGEDVLKKLEDKFNQSVHMNAIFYALLADCPYELYWIDSQFTWGYSSVRQGGWVSIEDLTVYLQAAPSYRGSDSSTVSAARVSEAKKAADNAKAIVAKYKDRSDYEKLIAYREEICRLTSYDVDTYESDAPYGDPWQLVYVFDGDPDTNVVCEGYAKAFKYLCDLSDFTGDVTCYTVSGTMGGGGHMWNVVRMGDGRNYLVDVTNCDSGMIGADDKLFLAGGTSGDSGRTCVVSKEQCRAVYTYRESQQGLFTDGYLVISEEDYVDRPPVTITVAPPSDGAEAPTITVEPPSTTPSEGTGSGSAPAFTDVAADAYYVDYVAWAVEQGITNGTTKTTFSPGQDCTQAQILTFLWRAARRPEAEGQLTIPEVAEAYRAAILWADSMGMIDQAEFDPNQACTRADAVQYIWCAFERPSAQASAFTDVPSDAPYAQAVGWALERGVTTGDTEVTFNPGGICSRAQIAAFLYRAYH